MGRAVKIGRGVFAVGDCFDAMKLLPDQSVRMVLCDLPYGATQNKWDSVLPLDTLWSEYKRLCSGAVVLTASQPFATTLISSAQNLFRYDLIWKKNKSTGHLNAKRVPLRQHEHVLVFAAGRLAFNPQKTVGNKLSNYAKRTKHSTNYGSQRVTDYHPTDERYPSSVLEFPVLNNDSPDRIHPTQKPVELFEYLIRTYTSEGDLVIDNTAGSGTTAIAAESTNRRWVCIERDEGYAEKAINRIRTHIENQSAHPNSAALDTNT